VQTRLYRRDTCQPPVRKLVGFLALPGISRREYAWEGGGGGGRRRRWCAVVAGRVAAAVLQYPRGYCSREQGGGGGRIRVGPWGRQSLIDCQTDYSPNNPKVFITNMKTLTTSTNPTVEDDRRLGRLRLQGLRPLLVGCRLGHNRSLCLTLKCREKKPPEAHSWNNFRTSRQLFFFLRNLGRASSRGQFLRMPRTQRFILSGPTKTEDCQENFAAAVFMQDDAYSQWNVQTWWILVSLLRLP
jgi:hypothetical protein